MILPCDSLLGTGDLSSSRGLSLVRGTAIEPVTGKLQNAFSLEIESVYTCTCIHMGPHPSTYLSSFQHSLGVLVSSMGASSPSGAVVSLCGSRPCSVSSPVAPTTNSEYAALSLDESVCRWGEGRIFERPLFIYWSKYNDFLKDYSELKNMVCSHFWGQFLTNTTVSMGGNFEKIKIIVHSKFGGTPSETSPSRKS